MKKITTHRTVSGWPLFCLLFTCYHALLSAQVTLCAPYPRQLDQAYICFVVDNSNEYHEITLKLDQRATVHSPVRFVFPSFTLSPTLAVQSLSVDFGDGLGMRSISSGSSVSVVYASGSQATLSWSMTIAQNGTPLNTYLGTLTYQCNSNSSINYNSEQPDETWGDMSGNSFTPPVGAYPSGSPYAASATAGGLVHIRYANPDHKMRKPFILVEGFDPIITSPSQYAVNNTDGTPLGFGSVRWDVLTTGRNEAFDEDPTEAGVPHTPQFALFPTLLAQVRAKGYDLIYEDFADADNYV